MTYKHKLARRLALSRTAGVLLSMVPLLLLLAACTDETTGPNTGSPQVMSARVVPKSVTIETNQKIRFQGEAVGNMPLRGLGGDVTTVTLVWNSSGGTISTDGVFAAAQPGTYKVVGRRRGHQNADTSTVVVVPPVTGTTGIQVTPGSTSLQEGASRTFTAAAVLSDGSTAPVGVNWAATGGKIDAGGGFTAGTTAGNYRVIATTLAGDMADTSLVTITAPTLTSVIVNPASYSLNVGDAKQFSAYGRNSLGDSIAVQVAFSATGGTVTSAGLYTAGQNGGTYRVVASASGLADTAVVTIAAPTAAPAPSGAGTPFGFYRLLSKTSDPGVLTLSAESNTASTIIDRIAYARSKGVRVMLMPIGYPHQRADTFLLSPINGVIQFDRAKWERYLRTFNLSTIKQAVAAGVADGTIIGATVMDEPYVSGGPTGAGNTWGPKGTMTKARVDSLCQDMKAVFPTLPVGAEHQHQLFEPTKSYATCDFIVDQYSADYGSVTNWRDDGLAMAARDHHAILFSLNVLDGGLRDTDGTWDCTGTGQAGKGTYSPMCRMTPSQLTQFGSALGTYGCGLFMWRYDDVYATSPDNATAMQQLAAKLASTPARACRRT